MRSIKQADLVATMRVKISITYTTSAFDLWADLEDEKDLLNDTIKRIKKFRDI